MVLAAVPLLEELVKEVRVSLSLGGGLVAGIDLGNQGIVLGSLVVGLLQEGEHDVGHQELAGDLAANAHDEQEAVTYKAPQDAEPAFTISRDDDGTWVLSGAKLERLFVMTNLDHEDSQLRFARQLRHMGVDDALREAGIQDGDLVRIEDFVFEFVQ